MQIHVSLNPVQAKLSDAHSIWSLRRQLEDWIFSKGLNQWVPGEMSIETVRAQINTGQWHVLKHENDAVAALRILWSDPDFWGSDDYNGIYVHGLMCDRGYQGHRIGERLLDWAALQGAAKGKRLLRLDCAADNQKLCDYYAKRGFTPVGEKKFEGALNDVVLWQRPIEALETDSK